MKYENIIVLHEDPAAQSPLVRGIFIGVIALILISAVFLWSTGESEGAVALFAEAFLITSILRIVLPRKFQVYADHLRIVLGGPLGINIGFDQITKVETTDAMDFTVNFVTTVTKSYVRIVKKQGFNFAITPANPQTFVTQANLALSHWTPRSSSPF